MKKQVTFLSACLLIVGFLLGVAYFATPATAKAAGMSGDAVCVIDSAQYDNLEEALSSVGNGETKTIRLLRNINYDKTIAVENKTITFNTNGYILNVINESGDALNVGSGGVVDLDTSGGGAFNVTSNEDHYRAIYAHNGGRATISNATVTGYHCYAVCAYNTGSFIRVKGNITVSNDISYGAASYDHSSIEVIGNITVVGDNSFGVYAQTQSSVSVTGDITVNGSQSMGVYAESSDCIVTINGNIMVTGMYTIAINSSDSTITVNGNAAASGNESIGAKSISGSTVTINGTLSAQTYIKFDYDTSVNPTEFVRGTPPYEHYKIYNYIYDTVMVKNNIPLAKTSIPVQSLEVGATTTFTASDLAQDEDNDALTITAIATGPDGAIATASLDSEAVQ